ncbi:MAG: hypothetical protein IKU12_06685 [Oscillospiraceae bacterium]|nr:hypothetical protein [Oscillospiraceae bacterium]
MDFRFNARINYQYSMSLFSLDDERSEEEKLRHVYNNLKQHFDCIAEWEEAAKTETVFSEINTVQGFLHGDGLPFKCGRFLIRGLGLSFDDLPMEESAVLLTVFPEFNAAQLKFCFKTENRTTDEMIYLRQIFCGGATFTAKDGTSLPLKDWSARVTEAMNANCANLELTYFTELKDVGCEMGVDELIEQESQRLYGIMTGDEGWQFVPKSLTDERMQQNWGSRDFVRVVIFGANGLLLNLNRSHRAAEYMARQEDFGGKCYGGVNPYFLVDSNVAGLCHGVFHAQETVEVIKTISGRILARKTSFESNKSTRIGREIQRVNQFRAELITTLNRVENLGISEIGELEQLLLNSYHISPLIDSIKYLLELLESELELLYNQSTNRLVNFLTILSLILTVVSTAAEFMK